MCLRLQISVTIFNEHTCWQIVGKDSRTASNSGIGARSRFGLALPPRATKLNEEKGSRTGSELKAFGSAPALNPLKGTSLSGEANYILAYLC